MIRSVKEGGADVRVVLGPEPALVRVHDRDRPTTGTDAARAHARRRPGPSGRGRHRSRDRQLGLGIVGGFANASLSRSLAQLRVKRRRQV